MSCLFVYSDQLKEEVLQLLNSLNKSMHLTFDASKIQLSEFFHFKLLIYHLYSWKTNLTC